MGAARANSGSRDPDRRTDAARDRGRADELVGLLSRRFGDGLVYFRGGCDRALFDLAIERGLLTSEGYLTRLGRSFLLRSG